MCRGFQQTGRDRLLKIKAFYLLLSVSKTRKYLPDSLTLHYLPRMNGSPLEINESVVRPDTPAFVTLYRAVSQDDRSGEGLVMYGSRERVRASEGVRFEVYLREEKVVKGGFRKDEGGGWKMECRCGLEGETVVVEVKDVEVCVASEGEVEVMREKVEMVVRRKRGRCFERLEEIPEQQSEGEEAEECGCCCCCDGEGEDEEEGSGEAEAEVEGVSWAVDVGIWVMCLGVGYLVMKRKRRLL